MNYFELFEIPVGFFPDLSDVKKKYHQLSFKFHPDFHSSGSDFSEAEILDKSVEINEAYQTLVDEDKRQAYILKLVNALPEEGQATVPQMFLMEMMDVNEQLMELQLEPDQEKKDQLIFRIDQIENDIFLEVKPDLEAFSLGTTDQKGLKKITDFYLKRKYLLRLKQNLFIFAPS